MEPSLPRFQHHLLSTALDVDKCSLRHPSIGFLARHPSPSPFSLSSLPVPLSPAIS